MSKSRVSYPQTMRDKAKAEGKSLVTVNIDGPDYRTTIQGPMIGRNLCIATRALLLLCKMTPEKVEETLAENFTVEERAR